MRPQTTQTTHWTLAFWRPLGGLFYRPWGPSKTVFLYATSYFRLYSDCIADSIATVTNLLPTVLSQKSTVFRLCLVSGASGAAEKSGKGGGRFLVFSGDGWVTFMGNSFAKKLGLENKKKRIPEKNECRKLEAKLVSGLLPLWRLEIAFQPRITIGNGNPVPKVSTRATPFLGSRFRPTLGSVLWTLNPKKPETVIQKKLHPMI